MASSRPPSPALDVEASTPVPDTQQPANAAAHTPSDSLVSVSLSEGGRASSLVPADAGADPATLFHNTFHLLAHKRLHLLTQVALGPILLALIWWKIPRSGARARGVSCASGMPAFSDKAMGFKDAVAAGSGGAFG